MMFCNIAAILTSC